jgi:hypothetical protein
MEGEEKEEEEKEKEEKEEEKYKCVSCTMWMHAKDWEHICTHF